MKRFLVALLLAACATTPVAAEMLAEEAAFPEWKLRDHNGQTVSSADLRGSRYVLWYYPKAMTPGCTAEGNAFRESFASFEEKKVEIFGVSFDPPADNAKFVEAEGFPFRLLSDSDRKLASEIGAVASPSQAYASRISYLVGPDGKVEKAYATVSPNAHAGEILGDLN